MKVLILPLLCLCSGVQADSSVAQALTMRAAAPAGDGTALSFDRVLLGKECSFCIQANFDFNANFGKLAQAIAGLASEVKEVEAGLERMEKDLSEDLEKVARGIEDLAKSISLLGADMLLRIVAMRGFLNQVKSEIDLGILVTELQTSISRISHRQTMIDALTHDKSALTPEEKNELVTAIRDINEGSALDTQIIHSVMTGDGAVVPGVKPAMEVYIEKGYRLQDLGKIFGALFVYQFHGYGQLFWAEMNHQPNVTLLEFNETSATAPNRLAEQWTHFGSPYLWGCYWDNGFRCPDRTECHANLRGLDGFACNSATAPVAIDISTGGKASGANAFTLGAASADIQLEIAYIAASDECTIGVQDCSGTIGSPILVDGETTFNCDATVQMQLTTQGTLVVFPYGTASSNVTVADASSPSVTTYSLFVDEIGALSIEGTTANGRTALWTQPAPPVPASGPCPTNFTNRLLKEVTSEGCKCITTPSWRRVAAGLVNVTASWCAKLCQSDPQYVCSTARTNGECWCGTQETLEMARSQSINCQATCSFCPGSVVEPCGTGNSVGLYSWSPGAQLRKDLLVI